MEGEDFAVFSGLLVVMPDFDQVDAQKLEDELHWSCVDDCENASDDDDLDFTPPSFFGVHCLLAVIYGIEAQQESFVVGIQMRYGQVFLDCAVGSRVLGENVFILDFAIGIAFWNVLVVDVVFAVQKARMHSLLSSGSVKHIWELENEIGLTGSSALAIALIVLLKQLKSGLGHLRRILWSERGFDFDNNSIFSCWGIIFWCLSFRIWIFRFILSSFIFCISRCLIFGGVVCSNWITTTFWVALCQSSTSRRFNSASRFFLNSILIVDIFDHIIRIGVLIESVEHVPIHFDVVLDLLAVVGELGRFLAEQAREVGLVTAIVAIQSLTAQAREILVLSINHSHEDGQLNAEVRNVFQTSHSKGYSVFEGFILIFIPQLQQVLILVKERLKFRHMALRLLL